MAGVVVVNDKILIIGGCDVTMYDITKNEFKELKPLPCNVSNIATVKFEKNVVLAGSNPREGFKNTVISYNIETQKSTELSAMKNVRSECCAVVDGNSLVVMGGKDEGTVEAFDFKTSKWRNLPSMNEARRTFTAEIV